MYHLLISNLEQDVHDPWGGVVAEVPQGDCGRGVDRAEEPEDDDGEEAAHAEHDEDAAGVDDGADQKQQAEEDEDAWKGGHCLVEKKYIGLIILVH